MKRRDFFKTSLGAALAGLAPTAGWSTALSRRPQILLRSSWQTINIGDIAHTPGVLALLEKHLPEADVSLWPSNVGNGVRELLQRRFPKVTIVQGEALKKAFSSCDFLLHGSGPSLVAADSIERWVEETGKPYGIYGITLPGAGERELNLLSKARFVFFRDSVSLEFARRKGVTSPVLAFGPDGAFGADVKDDAKALAFLARHDLHEGQFLCCIPRYRNTPEWLIPSKNKPINEVKQAINEKRKEHDHAPLREAICKVVSETSLKVLICPEDETQVALGKEMLFDKLPEAVKARVVWRPNFWLTDEAISTYVRSAGLFGNEMHSPILCIGHGIPAIVCRWDTQTTKGIMWRDIGLGDWLFDFDNEEEVKRLPDAVLAMAKNPAMAKEKTAKARAFVQERQRETMAEVKRNV